MSLVHYVRPFLELGICKEYLMARKTTGTTAPRVKKTEASTPPAEVQAAPEVVTNVAKEAAATARQNTKSAKSKTAVAANAPASTQINLEDAIRRRAYELYLERRATSGGESGDSNQDWLVAEREIRSLQGGSERHSA